MNNRGSILFHRKLRNHWLWKNRIRATWWIDILCEVNYKPDHFNIDGKLIACGRGQSVKSLRTWAAMWGVSQTTVKRFFELLERDRIISIENLKRTTRITVLNYDLYQKSMSQLTDTKSEGCKDESNNVVTTCDENALQLIDIKSESCEDERYNLDEKSVTNRSNEEVFNGENSLGIKSSLKSRGDTASQNASVELPDEKKEVELSEKKMSPEEKYNCLSDEVKTFSIKKALIGEDLTPEEKEKVKRQCREFLTANPEEDEFWNEAAKEYTSKKC
jgi:DNA-binding transcriptional regulator YhcF (GntR family)